MTERPLTGLAAGLVAAGRAVAELVARGARRPVTRDGPWHGVASGARAACCHGPVIAAKAFSAGSASNSRAIGVFEDESVVGAQG